MSAGVPKPLRAVTPTDIARAVLHSDSVRLVASKKNLAEVEQIVRAALLSLGTATLGTGHLDVDLGNGYDMRLTLLRKAADGAAAGSQT